MEESARNVRGEQRARDEARWGGGEVRQLERNEYSMIPVSTCVQFRRDIVFFDIRRSKEGGGREMK